MGFGDGLRQGAEGAARAPIAAFDFDGTLTVRDSFMAFLKWRTPPVRFIVGAAKLGLATAAYLFDRDRERLKAKAVRVFLAGMTRAELDAEAERFAEAAWPRLMRPDALATWEQWGRDGAMRVIVTASPESIVGPFARRLGADRLIGTRLNFDSQDRVSGTFDTRNCRAAEKVERLKAAFGPDIALAAAYGDTSGDHEMIAIAEVKGYRVFKDRP